MLALVFGLPKVPAGIRSTHVEREGAIVPGPSVDDHLILFFRVSVSPLYFQVNNHPPKSVY